MKVINSDELMKLYKDRYEVISNHYGPNSSECGILSGVIKLLDEYSSEMPDIVHCQDCVHSERPGNVNPGCKIHYTLGEWNDFCNKSERIDDAETTYSDI